MRYERLRATTVLDFDRQAFERRALESRPRAEGICAFADEIARGEAHGFYVRYTKFQTVDERKRILRDANLARARYRATLPEDVRRDRREVARRMMKDRIHAGQSYGKWNDEWIVHPSAHHERAEQGRLVADRQGLDRRGTEGGHVPQRRDRPDRQRVHDDPPAVQRAGAADRDIEQPQHGLAWVRAVRSADAGEVSHDLPGREQLRPDRRRRQDPGDAPRSRAQAADVRGPVMAGSAHSQAAALPPQGSDGAGRTRGPGAAGADGLRATEAGNMNH